MLPPVIHARNKSNTVVSLLVMKREASEGQTLFDNLRRLSESRDAESQAESSRILGRPEAYRNLESVRKALSHYSTWSPVPCLEFDELVRHKTVLSAQRSPASTVAAGCVLIGQCRENWNPHGRSSRPYVNHCSLSVTGKRSENPMACEPAVAAGVTVHFYFTDPFGPFLSCFA